MGKYTEKEFNEWYEKEFSKVDLDDDEQVAEFEHKLEIAKRLIWQTVGKKEILNEIINLNIFDKVFEDNYLIVAVCDEYGLEFYVTETNVTFYVFERYVNVDMWDYITMAMEKLNEIIGK